MTSITIGSNPETFVFDVTLVDVDENTVQTADLLAQRIHEFGFSEALPERTINMSSVVLKFVLAVSHRDNLAQAQARIDRVVMMVFRPPG